MQSRGLDPETRSWRRARRSPARRVADALDLEIGAPTLYLERLRLADGEPLLLEQVHLPAERFPGLLASDLEHNSLYEPAHRALRDPRRPGPRGARADPAPGPRGAALLGQPSGRPALLVEGVAYAADGVPVEFARSFVRGDRTRYYVERVVVRSATTSSTAPVEEPGAGAGMGRLAGASRQELRVRP